MFETITEHSIKVIVAGNDEKTAKINATRQVAKKGTAKHYALSGDYNATVIKYTPTKILPTMIKPYPKVSLLTKLQIKVVENLLNGDQFWYYPEEYRWRCGDMTVGTGTLISMMRKEAIKCAPMTNSEQAVQVALGTMQQDAIQLILDPTSEEIKKIKKKNEI